MERAIPFLVHAGIQNSGQTCSTLSRILVQEGIYKNVIKKISERYRNLRAAPAIENCESGPVISNQQMSIINSHLKHRRDLKLAADGTILKGTNQKGFYVRLKLFETNNYLHISAQKEIFGSIQIVIPFKDENEAVEISNSTDFGLVASVWSENGSR